MQFDPAADTQERLGGLLAALAELRQPCLLVVDNANELADLVANYLHLRGAGAGQYFRQAGQLWEELVAAAPQYAQFQHFLAIVRRDLVGRPVLVGGLAQCFSRPMSLLGGYNVLRIAPFSRLIGRKNPRRQPANQDWTAH